MNLAEIHRDRVAQAIHVIAHNFHNEYVRLDARHDRVLGQLQILRCFDDEAWYRGHKWVDAYMEQATM